MSSNQRIAEQTPLPKKSLPDEQAFRTTDVPNCWISRLSLVMHVLYFVVLTVLVVGLGYTWLEGSPFRSSVAAVDKDDLQSLKQAVQTEVRDGFQQHSAAALLHNNALSTQNQQVLNAFQQDVQRRQEQIDGINTSIQRLINRPDNLPVVIVEELKKIRAETGKLDQGTQQLKDTLKQINSDKGLTGQLGSLQTAAASLSKNAGDISKKLDTNAGDISKKLDTVEKHAAGMPAQINDLKTWILKHLTPPPTPSKVEPVPTEVLVLALHSENLHINNYIDAFENLHFDHKLRALAPTYQLGFTLVDGGNYDIIFPLDGGDRKKGEDKFKLIRGPHSDSTDRLSDLGVKVRAQFKEPDKKMSRCVVVASTRCVPVPPHKLDEWKDVIVDVILINTDAKAPKFKHEDWMSWMNFCTRCRGGLRLIDTATGLEEDPDVLRQLTVYLRDLTHPLYPVLTR